MIETIYNHIKDGQEVRKNLIALKAELKDPIGRHILLPLFEGDYSILYKLLKDEDPKVRKNTALIMGELAIPQMMEKLYEAYTLEEKLFVKADYLVALNHFDYMPYLSELKEQLAYLTNNTFEENNQKHIQEQIKLLDKLCMQLEKPEMHTFIGYQDPADIILLTNKEQKEVTLKAITEGVAKTFNAGIVARVNNLNEVLNIRTYSELLFRIKDVATIPMEPTEAAKQLFASDLLNFLQRKHEGATPFYFRIELKSKLALDKKSTFVKKMATALERLSNRQLINSTSSYEVEIRLIENKEGKLNVLLKLYTLKDIRFDYRKNTIAASISPNEAALVIELAKPYLQPDAQVLDPFCGVGTMLIERGLALPSKVMYGIDIFGEAIDGAIENTNLADMDIYFINKDFFAFSHKYLFDEIITNMPTNTLSKSFAQIDCLYQAFFDRVSEIINEKAVLVIYTRDEDLLKKYVGNGTQFTVVQNYTLARKEAVAVYILKFSKP